MSEPIKKIVKLYDGTITVHFSNLARNRYMIQETQHSPVGVTTILQTLSKPGLALWPMYEALDWLKKNPDDFKGAEKAYTIKSDKGKDTGTIVHNAVENFLVALQLAQAEGKDAGDFFQVDMGVPEATKAYNAFIGWAEQLKPKVLATEQIIYSKQFDYAGTYDCLLEIDGQVVLCDVKTTNISRTAPLGIYPEMFLQLGAYAAAHHEENPEQQIDDVMIIRVGKDGVLNTMRASELGFKLAYLEDTFKQLVQVYRMINPLSKQLTEMGVKKNVTTV